MQTIDIVRSVCYGYQQVDATCIVEHSPMRSEKYGGERIFMQDKHTEWPGLEHYADIPLFNTRAVAQQTGIAAHGARGYLILSPQRAQNDYRLYSERDIAIIRWLKAHVDEGMSISQAIALFRHLEDEQSQLHQRTSASKESSSPATYDLYIVQERLLEAFTKLDEDTASRLMASVLAIYPLEQVCTQLVSPALWEIGRLWEQGLISVSIEHFASAFFHGC